MYEKTLREVKIEYERRQKEASDRLQARIDEVYSRIPELEKLDMEAKLLGIHYNRLILEGEETAESAALKLDEQLRNIRKEKLRLLTNAGYSPDYLEMQYICPRCRDTGFVEVDGLTEKCSCYRQLLIEHLYRLSNIGALKNITFDKFDADLFSDAVDVKKYGIPVSPRENIINIKNACLKFVENFNSPEEKNLFFTGPTGVGKTFMAGCIASSLLDKGVTVLYLTAPALFNEINETRARSFKEDTCEDSVYKNIFEVELLIIDDLGTESPTAARYAELLNIINTRLAINAQRPCKTIISSNVGIKQLYEYYDERIASRIVGNFNIYLFAGDDLRKTLALKEKRQ